MSSADGERIAPVTYLFRARAEEEVQEPDSPSAASPARGPVFVDLGGPSSEGSTWPAEPTQTFELTDAAARAAALRAELEQEAREHVARDRRAAEASAGDGEASGARRAAGRREPGEKRAKGSFDRISNVSMHALARRGMSSREMHEYLVGREFDAGEVDQEVERLESVGLLDDVLLAETLVRQLRERKGLGRSGVTAELRRRRLDPLATDIALEALDDDELERATEIAHKRAGQLRSYDAETAKRRLGAFLQRKGYSGSVVSTAVQRALAPSGPTFR